MKSSEELEKELNRIQQSTKTSFRIFSLPHELFRQRFKGYYRWHLWPYHNFFHWLTLICYIFGFIFIFLWQFGAFAPQPQVKASAGIAKMLNYQGKLTNLSNIPQPDGSYNFTISIYDAESGGSCLWTWKGTCGAKQAVSVGVSNGIFSVMLGDTATYAGTNALSLDFNTDTYYLGVDVGGDGEMVPRKRIGAVGYAYNADTVDGKNETDFALLVGRNGGQTLIGGTAAADDLILQSTSGNASGGEIILKTGNNGSVTALTVSDSGSVSIPNVSVTGGSVTGISDLAVADGGTGLGTIAAGSILGTNVLDTISAITSTVGITILQNNAGSISWVSPSSGVSTVGSMTASSVFSSSSASGQWLGLGALAGRIEFDDQATDEINVLSANVGIGTQTPNEKLTIDGNLSLQEQTSSPSATVDYGKIYAKKPTVSAGIDSYTKAILHMDGTDGSTTFTDGSNYSHTFTPNSGAQLDTAQQKFGTASGLFDGISDYLTSNDSTDWDIGTGDFTIDLWARSAISVASNAYRFAARGNIETVTGDWCWGVGHNDGWGTNIRMNFAYKTAGGIVDIVSSEITFNADTWYHVAVVRNGTTLKMYLDGTEVASTAVSADLSSSSAFHVGVREGTGPGGIAEEWNGWLDEFRFSNGIARWTTGFTPPTEAYSRSIYNLYYKNSQGTESALSAWYQDITGAKTYSTSDNVGIGNSNPNQKLSVAGTFGILETGASPTKYTILQGGDQAADLTYTLPTAYPAVSGYVLSSTNGGVMSWVAQSSGPWTDGGTYLYPTAYESLRVYDSGGTDYIDIAHDGTDAIISFANTTALNINIGVLDLSNQTVDVTLNNAADALNFDSNTLSIDALNNMVGIGSSTPEFRLTLDKGAATPDGGILAVGTYNSGTALSTSGAGTRLIWYPKKAAFRAGYVDSTQWNDANIGGNSVAFGSGTKASGLNSVALGNNTTASGGTSTAMGALTTASGLWSMAVNYDNTASGIRSMAMGLSTIASNNQSVAMGQSTTSSGYNTVAAGITTTAQAYASLVIGRYNVISGTTDSWVSTDQLFVIGNGTGTGASAANAVTVLKNGNTAFGPSSPSYKIDVSTSTANDRGINIAQTATTGTNYAGYFSATGSGATANYGVYATASGATTNYAGYFDGKLLTTDVGGTNHVYDVAELIPAGSSVENGDVVVANSDNSRQAIKSSAEYSPSVIGVIPENPWLTIGDKNKANEANPDKNYQYLTLAGQAKVKFDTYNGSIKPGDPLTSSNNPGYAMKATKAGSTIGIALEPLESGTGKILALINLSYYNPTDGNNLQGSDNFVASKISSPSDNDLVIESGSGKTIIKDNLVVERKIITQDIEVKGHVIGSSDSRGKIKIVSQTKEIWHPFENPYAKEPVIVITPTNDPKVRYYVEALKEGFWVKLSDFAQEDIEFNWLAQE
ncbi:MAG: hypothetical protein M1338_01500 [Patescibacteria group bacterium]|nr:hypothetical protein [Patescibacteria group bacterium]